MEEYEKALKVAENSEDAAALQTLKSLDSITTKLQMAKTAWEEFYNSMGLEETAKNTLDVFAQMLTNLSDLNKFSAFSSIISLVKGAKTLITGIFNGLKLSTSKLTMGAREDLNNIITLKNKLSDPEILNLNTTKAEGQIIGISQLIKKVFGTKTNLNLGNLPNVSSQVKFDFPKEKIDQTAKIMMDIFDKKNKNAPSGWIKDGKITDGAVDYIGSRMYGKDWKNKDKQDSLRAEVKTTILPALNDSLKDYPKLAKRLGIEIDKTGRDFNIKLQGITAGLDFLAGAFQVAGAGITAWGLAIEDKSTDKFERSKTTTGWGQLFSAVGSGISGTISGAMGGAAIGAAGGPIGALGGAIIGGLISFLPGAIASIKTLFDGYNHTLEERIEEAEKEYQELENESTLKKGEYVSLKQTIEEIEELGKAQYNSAEDMEAYKNKLVEVSEKYPSLITTMGTASSAIFDAEAAENALAAARQKSAAAATEAAMAEYNKYFLELQKEKQQSTSNLSIDGENAYIAFSEGKNTSGMLTGDKEMSESLARIALFDKTLFDKYVKYLSFSAQNRKAYNGEFVTTLESFSKQEQLLLAQSLGFTGFIDDAGKWLDSKIKSSPGNRSDINYAQIATWLVSSQGDKKAAIDQNQVEQAYQKIVSTANVSSEPFSNFDSNFEKFTAMIMEGLSREDLERVFRENQKQAQFFLSIYDNIKNGGTSPIRPVELGSESPDWGTAFSAFSYSQNLELENLLKETNQFEKNTRFSQSLSQLQLYESQLPKIERQQIEKAEGVINNLIYSDYNKKLEELKIDKTKTNTLQDAKANEAFKESVDNMISFISKNYDSIDNLLFFEENVLNFKDEKDLDEWINASGLEGIKEQIKSSYSEYISSINIRIGDFFKNRKEDDLTKIIQPLLGKGIPYQYTDFIIKWIKQVDSFTSQGLDTKSDVLQKNLISFFSEISDIEDFEIIKEIFSLITQIDFLDIGSITTAIESIQKYAEAEGHQGAVEGIIQSLENSKDEIFVNVNTLFNSWVEDISSASETLNNKMEKAASGVSLQDALKDFESFDFGDLTFDEVYSYSEELGKWVYTTEGLKASIQKEAASLKNEILKLKSYEALFTGEGDLTAEAKQLKESGTEPAEEREKLLLSLYDEWLESEDENKGEFATYIESKEKMYKAALTNSQQMLDSLKTMAFSSLNVDDLILGKENWSKMLTASAELLSLEDINGALRTSFTDVEQARTAFVNTVLSGNLSLLEEVSNIDFTSKIDKSKVELYTAAIQELTSVPAENINELSDNTKDILVNLGLATKTDKGTYEFVEGAWNGTVEAARALLQDLAKMAIATTEQITAARATIVEDYYNIPEMRKGADFFKADGSYTAQQLLGLVDKERQEELFGKDGKITSRFEKYLEIDESTGDFKVKKGMYSAFAVAMRSLGADINLSSYDYLQSRIDFAIENGEDLTGLIKGLEKDSRYIFLNPDQREDLLKQLYEAQAEQIGEGELVLLNSFIKDADNIDTVAWGRANKDGLLKGITLKENEATKASYIDTAGLLQMASNVKEAMSAKGISEAAKESYQATLNSIGELFLEKNDLDSFFQAIMPDGRNFKGAFIKAAKTGDTSHMTAEATHLYLQWREELEGLYSDTAAGIGEHAYQALIGDKKPSFFKITGFEKKFKKYSAFFDFDVSKDGKETYAKLKDNVDGFTTNVFASLLHAVGVEEDQISSYLEQYTEEKSKKGTALRNLATNPLSFTKDDYVAAELATEAEAAELFKDGTPYFSIEQAKELYKDRPDLLETYYNSITSSLISIADKTIENLTPNEIELLKELDSESEQAKAELSKSSGKINLAPFLIALGNLTNFTVEELLKGFEQKNKISLKQSKKNLLTSFDSINMQDLLAIDPEAVDAATLEIANDWKDIIEVDGFGNVELKEDVDFDTYWDSLNGDVEKYGEEWLESFTAWLSYLAENGLNQIGDIYNNLDKIDNEEVRRKTIEGLKEYNQAQAERADKDEKNIFEEISTLQDIEGADTRELTQLYTSLNKEQIKTLNNTLDNYGATFSNGLLEVQQGADIRSIISTLSQTAYENGLLLESDFVALQDVVSELLNNLVSMIEQGISGNLKLAEKDSLKNSLKLDDTSFFQTAEGWKLTQQGLADSYAKLIETDQYSAEKLLSVMVENAQETDDELSNIYSTQKKLNKIQEKRNKLEGKNTDEYKKQNNILKMQSDIAELAQQRMIAAGNAFNFMESNIPTEVTNPLSAWEGLSQAGQVLLGAEFEEGRMSYEDIRAMATYLDSMNISLSNGVTGMQLLQAATNGLTIDDETASLFVDLNTFGEAAFDAEMMWEALMKASLKNAENQKALLEKRQVVLEAYDNLEASQKEEGYAENIKNYEDFYKGMAALAGIENIESNWALFASKEESAVEAAKAIQLAFNESIEAGLQAFDHYQKQMAEGKEQFTAAPTIKTLEESADVIANVLQGGEINLQVSGALDQLKQVEEKLQEMQNKGYEIDLVYSVTSKQKDEQTAGGTYEVNIEDNGTAEALSGVAGALAAVQTSASNFISATDKIQDKSGAVKATADAINSLQSKSVTATVNVTVNVSGENINGATSQTGINLGGDKAAIAKAKGTLMGELGPELVSANGRYFTVGENGAEFVNLPNDAIVFNHLQTKKLLENGHISSFGKPITDEKTAVSFAKGNAMANAKTNKETISLWDAMMKFAGAAGGLKSSGGAGGKEEAKASLHDLERWYNLLRQIEKLEQQITYQQQLRANLTSGYDHVDSLEKELRILEQQKKTYEQLAGLQRSFYDRRREDLRSTEYSKIFTYDKDGLMQYVDGEGRGLDALASLNATDAMGIPLMTNKQQVEYLKKQGFDMSQFMTKADGTKIKNTDYAAIMEVFWSGIDSWMDELDSLYDEYNDHIISIEETQEAQNEILQEYIDNQRAVEDKLFQAIEDREQAEIDRFQKNLDATQEATSKYLEGLNRALDKEREMYSRNEEDAETSRLQRQLAILQRSGGSASEIRSLQDQIDSRLQDSYFSEQERQIQAVQEASDLQLEKMQQQLDVMNETLEYQKENGLLWQEVSDMMMNWTPEAMLDFIERFTKSYREDSQLENEEKSKEALKEAEIWVAKQQEKGRNSSWETYLKDAKTRFDEKTITEKELEAKEAYLSSLKEGKTETEAGAAADEIFNNIKKKEENNESLQDSINTKGDTTSETSPKTQAKKWQFTWDGETYKGYSTQKEAQAALDKMTSDYQQKYMVNNVWKYASAVKASEEAYKEAMMKRGSVTAYRTGGLVDFTGPAWVDGTKAKPEAFLSAEDTALLKSKIFSNSNYSLKSVIEMLESLGRSFSSIDNSSNNREVVFENVEVNIAANAIASDYDARRAGEQVLEELMSIARRNSNIGVARR